MVWIHIDNFSLQHHPRNFPSRPQVVTLALLFRLITSNQVEVSGADHLQYVESRGSFLQLTCTLELREGYGGPAKEVMDAGI